MADDNTAIDDQLTTVPNPEADKAQDDAAKAAEAAEKAKVDEALDEYGMDETNLDLLTEEERTAFLNSVLGSGDDDTPAGENADDAAAATKAEEEAAAAAQDEVAAAAAKAEADRQARAEQRRAQETTLTALETRAQEAQDARQAILEGYKNGDLDDDEFDEKMAAANRNVEQISFEMGASKAPIENEWEQACVAFTAANPAVNTEEHFTAFNKVLGGITTDARYEGLSNEEVLNTAKEMYELQLKALGKTLGETKPADDPGKKADTADTKKDTPKAEEADDKDKLKVLDAKNRPSGPTTLADIPSETADPNQSAMAQLEARFEATNDPDERERLLASMPEHVQDEFLSRA